MLWEQAQSTKTSVAEAVPESYKLHSQSVPDPWEIACLCLQQSGQVFDQVFKTLRLHERTLRLHKR